MSAARLFWCFAIFFISRAAFAAEPVAVIPFRTDYNGWLTVEARVKGQGPLDFIIDTGSTRTLIFEQTVALIGGVRPSNGAPVSVIGLSSQKKFPTFYVGDVEIGGQTMPDLLTVILPDWRVEGRAPHGVIGLDFLEQFHVEFDSEAGLMRLFQSTDPYAPPARSWKSAAIARETFHLEEKEGLYLVDVSLNAARVPFMIDLGATGSIVNERAANLGAKGDRTGFAISINRGRGASRIKDASSEKATTSYRQFSRVRIGKTVWRDVGFSVFEAPIFAELGVEDEPFGLIGVNLFEHRSFAFDFAHGRLFIGPMRKGPTR